MNLKTVTLTGPTGETIMLGTLTGDFGYTLESTRFNAAERTQFASPLPLVPGGVVAPGRQSFRTVAISGLIVAPTDAEAAELASDLAFLLRDAGSDPVFINYTPEATELELSGYLSGAVQFQPVQGGPWMRYQFEIDCPNPVALGDANTEDITSIIVNAGTAPTWPIITATLVPNVTSLRIGSTTSGDFVQLDGLTTETEVVIVSEPGFENVLLDGAAGLDKLAFTTTFFPLLPGSNDLYITVLTGDGTATATVDWRDGYLL